MDPSVSYEQMIAYQAGVEHSRSFEAFKRSREEAMSHHLDGASRRGAREMSSCPPRTENISNRI